MTRPDPCDKGFTLAEILIVILLIAIVSVWAIPSWESLISVNSDERALRIVSGAVAYAQDESLMTGETHRVVISLTEGTVEVFDDTGPLRGPEARPIDLPSGLGLEIITPSGTSVSSGDVSITILPDGSAEPYRFRFGEFATAREFSLNPITGLFEESDVTAF